MLRLSLDFAADFSPTPVSRTAERGLSIGVAFSGKITLSMRPSKIWFEDQARLALFTRYRQIARREDIPLMVRQRFRTILLDVSRSDADLLAACTSNCRNEIRRGDKEGLTFASRRATTEDLRYFAAFMSLRGLGKANERYAADPHAYVTTAFRRDQRLVSHLYLFVPARRRARLIYSAVSQFPGANASSAQLNDGGPIDERGWSKLVGIANRWLHFQDLSFLRGQGLVHCDLGGLGDDEADPKIAGINRFKRSLGGEEVEEYNYDPLALALLEVLLRKVRKLKARG